MRCHQITLNEWPDQLEWPFKPDLILVFGPRRQLVPDHVYPALQRSAPNAIVLGCSTAGDIAGTRVSDDALIVTGIALAQTTLRLETIDVSADIDSRMAGAALARRLHDPALRHVLVLSDGLNVNGSELAGGLRDGLPPNVVATGGLAGDGAAFEATVVLANAPAVPNRVAALGWYGDNIRVGYGSLGGWDAFGPSRLVTRSDKNVLYRLDDEAALDVYMRYLGHHADELPSSGLLFPLALTLPGVEEPVVRTILSVDRAAGSLTFAGDVPQGCSVQLMHANFDRLIDGAIAAADDSVLPLDGPAQLALLISCVGRKLVLKQRIEEEVEGVREVVGPAATLAGFYSYGEICPQKRFAPCELHNQTMTITTFSEVP
ncbi:FIST signal transduction protein [Andreprevotia chitinilytica]|uniref:FIST signal transduction protein n=1 Tax=Andreprevotia chitinilytica TaxID=396808 RepID=UPI000557FECF|nr:FIST N-terminal domain-containing protein [Andreprevotia chitinilytica]